MAGVKATMQDVKDKQRAFQAHKTAHGCKTGKEICPEAVTLWNAITSTALLWNEPSDDS